MYWKNMQKYNKLEKSDKMQNTQIPIPINQTNRSKYKHHRMMSKCDKP